MMNIEKYRAELFATGRYYMVEGWGLYPKRGNPLHGV